MPAIPRVTKMSTLSNLPHYWFSILPTQCGIPPRYVCFPLWLIIWHRWISYGPLPDTLCPGACTYIPTGLHGLCFARGKVAISLNQLPIKIGAFQFLPTGLHGLCFGYCFAGRLPLYSLTNSPLFRVRFRESLVVRLYSEIDQLHLSIEAQCVSHLLPPGDCHTEYLTLFWGFPNRIPLFKC